MRYGTDSSVHARKMASHFPLVCNATLIGMGLTCSDTRCQSRPYLPTAPQCYRRPTPMSPAPLPNNDATTPYDEEEGGGRPSRNRKRPTDHVGAYPRARAFPAVPPSPPLVMQRHRILSCDGEAARRILVPQIDFTLLSPSAGGDTNLLAL